MPRAGENSLGYLMNQSQRLLTRNLQNRLRELGVSQPVYVILRHLEASIAREITPADVADDLRMDHSTISRHVDQAIEEGLVIATPHPLHRRARLLGLTDKGRALLPALHDAAGWTVVRGLNGFTNEEVGELQAYLRRMLRNLEEAEGPDS